MTTATSTNVLTNSTRRWCIEFWRRAKNRPCRGIARELGPAAKENLKIKVLASRELYLSSKHGMAEKVKELHLERDYKKYLYFVDGNGNVSRKSKSGEGETEVLVPNAIQRDNQYLYFVDKEGDVARSPRAVRRTAKKVA
jgi:hypothetical protein